MRGSRVMAAAALALAAGCGNDGTGPVASRGLLTGTYTGSAEVVGIETLEVTFSLIQDLGSVTGSFTAEDGTTGLVFGTTNGAEVDFTVAVTAPCVGEYDGFAEIQLAGHRLSGGYFGGLPCVGPLNATFVVDRP